MTYTLVCCIKEPGVKRGAVYDTEALSSNIFTTDSLDTTKPLSYINNPNYILTELPEDTNQDYINYMRTVKSNVNGKYITESYELDFTTDTFLNDYKRYTLKSVIQERNKKLEESDWTQVSDNGLSDELKEAWRVYRQALRDLPATYDLENPVWPEPPQ
jgi:hypothetical protein